MVEKNNQKNINSNNFKNCLLSIVISFYNEEDVLPELIRRLRDVLGTQIMKKRISSYELIFVNDDSTDCSEQILRNASHGYNDIRIITMSRNFGVSECAMAGIVKSSGDAVIYMDADLQDPPEVIPEMICAWQEGHNIDVVHTSRDSRDGESRIKLFITRIAYEILHRLTEFKLPRETGDFKLLSRRAVDHLICLKEKKPFVRGLICWIGFNQVFVNYKREMRFSGRTKFPVFSRRVIKNFLDSALISFSTFPLKLCLIVGMSVALGSFIFLFYIIVQKFLFEYTTPGWSALMVTILLLGGIQLISIGILGLYVSSIFLEVKGRPNYIIKNTFGFEPSKDSTTCYAESSSIAEI